MKPHLLRTLATGLAMALGLGSLNAQSISLVDVKKLKGCGPQLALEFIAPMPGEEWPSLGGGSPDAWNILLELAHEPRSPVGPGIFEGTFFPSPGLAAPLPTDVNADGIPGDPHPAIPNLTLVMDDTLVTGGAALPPGTNLASLIEVIGSELEHGGDQSTTLSWVMDFATYMLIDINGDMGTNLTAKLSSAVDTVFVSHGFGPTFGGVTSIETPTISIMTPDWISTVDSDIPSSSETPFVVAVEVRIPCWFNFGSTPPTPVPLDPIFGPCQGGTMACTGNFPPMPGPGFHPAFPSLDVRFSDDYFDMKTGTFVPGGVITGGTCGVIWGSTGASLAYSFQQASVHAWYGVNGVPDTTPLGGGDDQLIYRFVMNADGIVIDTDNLPEEMMITAAIESSTNCFSITNVRVKHRPDVVTRNP